MFKKKALVQAIAAAGCFVAAETVLASFHDTLGEYCGQKLEQDTTVSCGGYNENLTENCNIKLDKGADLTLNQCNVDADGYAIEIIGEKDSRLILNGNGEITGASKITFNLSGHDGGPCDDPPPIIELYQYDLEASESIDIKVSCGNIDIDIPGDSFEIFAEKYVNIEADKGNVYITGHEYHPSSVGASLSDGKVSVTGGGMVDIDDINLNAEEIKIHSGDGATVSSTPN